ncbi:Nuclear transcription factor Y subunit C-2 [Auxenochlorella protothecoides]|uniref:Nuclear transcription factor Y subunit C-2 n=1 Tax=Auxenochlorella protothecoides TaxID=3075 RepID=A0A087SFK2_AUXPR|nr:Nuclear transcription factor Y subunit C-2 [Auxenochlorella protothecoides]KFM24506.1 Nuclear transcription factor Y subunit C-2 [Auxenochlorella protothecoides]
MAAPDQQAPNSFGSFPNQPGPRTFTYYPNESLRRLWQEAKDEIAMTEPDPAHFKNQTLPLARIKKIMKSDEDVRMISAEAPVLFAKASGCTAACEFFVLELTQRAWQAAEENKRRTLQRNDVAMAIQHIDVFDFLLDIAGPGGYGTSPRFLQTQGMQYPQYHPSMGPPPQAGMYGSGGGQQQFVAPYHQPMAPVPPPSLTLSHPLLHASP